MGPKISLPWVKVLLKFDPICELTFPSPTGIGCQFIAQSPLSHWAFGQVKGGRVTQVRLTLALQKNQGSYLYIWAK